MYMKILIAGFIVLMALAFLSFRYNRKLKEKAKWCAQGAKKFHEELKKLSSPERLFTDEEVHKMKMKYAYLLDTVNDLYDSKFISNEYLDKLGLGDFMEERKLLNHTQFLNNRSHQD